MSADEKSDDGDEGKASQGLPGWYQGLDPEIASELGNLDVTQLYEIQSTIEWYEGGPPAHIAIRELELVVPGCGKQIVDEGIARSRLEREVVARHAFANLIKLYVSMGVAALMAIGSLSLVSYMLVTRELSPSTVAVLIPFMILGVGGPIAAARMANPRKKSSDDPEA